MSTVLQSLNEGLHSAMASDERVYVLGEDVLDPYGGAFKVTKGLSTAYPDRVMTTPVSEAGFVGVATGMALRGLRPVVEIMFGDFVTLITDQVVNGLSKYGWMYGGTLDIPIVIRTPMGGRRGYGPTHSQSLEKLFLGVPGLRVLAPTAFADPGALLRAAIADEGPVLFVENKLQYQRRLDDSAFSALDTSLHAQEGYARAVTVTVSGAPRPQLTIAAYGDMADRAAEAQIRMAYEQEVFVELVVLEQLDPLGPNRDLPAALTDSLRRTRSLLTVEEGTHTHGWGAEVVARASETVSERLSVRRVAALDSPIPAARGLEASVLPDVDVIVAAAQKLLGDLDG
ncbi:MAG TPA: transketolase C-terminal domain-containing protein [Acidimicrobiia bacterium]|nr:transketolase C-terminal domain-containing protein [Acidimicrobiia bacterium]